MNIILKKIEQLKISKSVILLTFIILIGLFLRVYRFPDLFYYTMDEEVMNLIQRRIVLFEHVPLIGSVSPLGTYLAPYFYYLGAVILALSNLNPIGQGILAALLGSFNIFLIYFVVKQLFNQRIAFFASLFYSTSFLMVLFDRRWWHLSLGPILSLTILLSLYKIKQGSIKFVYLLTIALILGWSSDYTNLVLFFFVGLTWILFRLPVKKKEILIALAIFLIANLPLVFFDLRHDFLNSKTFINYLIKKEQRHTSDRETLGSNSREQALVAVSQPFITFSRMIYIKSDLNVSAQHTYCKEYILERNNQQGLILPLISGFIILVLSFLTFKNWRKKDFLGQKLILSFYLIYQLGILIYAFIFKGDIFEHYLSTLMPHFFIMLAIIIVFIYQRFKLLGLSLALIIALINIHSLLTAYNPLSYQNKIQAAKYALEKVGDEDFSLDSIGSCFRYDGFYYPFLLNGRHPVKSYQDHNYSWLYNYQVAKDHPEKIVVMVAKGKYDDDKFKEAYEKYSKWVIDKNRFGDLEVLILDNKGKEF